MDRPGQIEVMVQGRELRVDPAPTTLSLALVRPAFAVVDRKFIFSSNAGELKRILETIAGNRQMPVWLPQQRQGFSQRRVRPVLLSMAHHRHRQ